MKEAKGEEEAAKLWAASGLDAAKFVSSLSPDGASEAAEDAKGAGLGFLFP